MQVAVLRGRALVLSVLAAIATTASMTAVVASASGAPPAAAAAAATPTSTAYISRDDVTSTGAQSVGPSNYPTVTENGRYIGFMSEAQDLVAGLTNNTFNSYVHDAVTGTTTDVSVASDDTQGNGPSYTPRVSANGRYAVFASSATNLVATATGGVQCVYLRDLVTGTTTLVSTSDTGGAPNGSSNIDDMSPDGTFIVFDSLATNILPGVTPTGTEVYLYDRLTGTTTLVSATSTGAPAGGGNSGGGVSYNGEEVAFTSTANNLPGATGGGISQVFERNVVAGTTTLVSVSLPGGPGNGNSSWPSLSMTGQYVVFQSDASDLVPSDTNGTTDIFERNMSSGVTVRVDVSSAGAQSNGQSLLYMPQHNAVSATGCRVVFYSYATNLVPHDTNSATDAFIHDCQTNRTTLISTDALGLEGWFPSAHVAISGDGDYAVFASRSMNLVPNDTNVATDIFEVYLNRDVVTSVSAPTLAPGSTGNTVTISGAGFQPNAVVLLGSGMTVTSTTVTPGQITAQVNVASTASTGSYTVSVFNPGTGPGAEAGAVASYPAGLTIG